MNSRFAGEAFRASLVLFVGVTVDGFAQAIIAQTGEHRFDGCPKILSA
ncbi:hypothetical protein ACFQY0_17095 [Haloferula chungangensis]|uniref:DUF1275 domain-containing protein n=1 Tax=Haloferula chungangensis TaxID=1048331 RepID=A0ABW2LDN3_9BACT